MSAYEIERKFMMYFFDILKFLKTLEVEYRSEALQQYYISSQTDPYTRFRKKGEQYFKTIKKGEGLIREEIESQITAEEYKSQQAHIIGRLITKTRYNFDYQGFTYEIDSFSGLLYGLIYLEIEFIDEKQAKGFLLPHRFRQLLYREVTEESGYSNYALSTLPYIPSTVLSAGQLDVFSPSSLALVRTIDELVEEIQRTKILLLDNTHDVEALHNFRVAIRKLRAMLGSFAEVMVKKERKRVSTTLSGVMQKTYAKRDNDVAVASFTRLKNETPELPDYIVELILDRYQKREKAFAKKLTHLIQSDELDSMIEMLLAIKIENRLFKEVANQPIIFTALEVIKKHLHIILESGEQIDLKSDEDAYRKIRIAFKKLRYTLGVLSFMIEESHMKLLLKNLKSIQLTLGDLHNIQIQKSEVEKIMQSYDEKKKKFIKLLKKMEKQERQLKRQFLEDFREFSRKTIDYETLFFRDLEVL